MLPRFSLSLFTFCGLALLNLVALPGLGICQTVNIYSQPAQQPIGEQLATGWVRCGDTERQIRLLQSELIPGEPLLAELAVRPIPEALDEVSFEFSDDVSRVLELLVQPEFGTPWEYSTKTERTFRKPTVIKISPGEVFRTIVTLSYDDQSVTGALLDAPGRYLLGFAWSCRESGEERMIQFNPMLVQVAQTAPDHQNTQALQLLAQKPEIFLNFQTGVLFDDAYQPALELLVQQFPEAQLSAHAAYALGVKHYLAHLKTNDQAELDSAYRMSTWIRERFPNHPLFFRSTILEVECLRRLNRGAEADALFYFLWQHPRWTHFLSNPEFARLDKEGKSARFFIKDWHVFVDPADGYLIGEDFKFPPQGDISRVDPVPLNIPIWDYLQ
ncbi:MAG: hypothetical protein SFY68_11230 [Candidatus Sumerlaeia bacterium]|nr:hypothetical protein [Candidatus Sumerlaeia bacterium]